MAKYGEWNCKGATLSDKTAEKEYGVNQAFIIKGIRDGKLEYREGVIYGNPYLRILRNQLEHFIEAELGQNYLSKRKNQSELRRIKKEISTLKKKLNELQYRKEVIEKKEG